MEVEARSVFEVAIFVDVRLQRRGVSGKDAEDFVALVFVAVNGNVNRGIAKVGRGLDADDGNGAEVESATGEDFVKGFGDFAVKKGVEAGGAGSHKIRLMADG